MRVLLINSPIRLDAKPSCIPYGLATIASTLRNAGHDVDIYDCNALREGWEQFRTRVFLGGWDIIGISGLITTYKWQTQAVETIREVSPESIIVQGGGLATSNPELCTADYVVHGEGEEAILTICRWPKPESPTHLSVVGPDTIDNFPLPAWDLLPMEIYLDNPIWGNAAGNSSGFLPGVQVKRSMNIVSSRGCPMACNYCFHIYGKGSYRQRSVRSVIAELDTLIYEYNIDFAGFVDDNMMMSEKWMTEFCENVAHRGVQWGCHGRVDSAKPELLKRMAAAGCVWIGYGIESGDQSILTAMNKNQTVRQARAAIINTKAAGIFPNTTFIYGYLGETPETIQNTIDFKRELGIKCGSFFATPYPGTVLYEQVKDRLPEDYISRLGNATEFIVNLTDMDDELFFEMKKRMDFA